MEMNEFIETFKQAEESGSKFIGVVIHMDGFPKDEIIINDFVNFNSKLAYYEKTYDENLDHRFAKGISIVTVVAGDSLYDIERQLNY